MADLCHVFNEMTFSAANRMADSGPEQRLIDEAIETQMGNMQEELGLAQAI